MPAVPLWPVQGRQQLGNFLQAMDIYSVPAGWVFQGAGDSFSGKICLRKT
jgi:hypothetical protein